MPTRLVLTSTNPACSSEFGVQGSHEFIFGIRLNVHKMRVDSNTEVAGIRKGKSFPRSNELRVPVKGLERLKRGSDLM